MTEDQEFDSYNLAAEEGIGSIDDELEDIDVDEFEDVDVDGELEAEVAEAEEPEDEDLPEWAETKTVEMYGREFKIGEPTLGITLRIIRVLGVLGVRGEKTALRALQSLTQGKKGKQGKLEVSWRAHIFGMLASLMEADLYALGSAVLQFEDDREGRKFLKNPPDGERLKLSPLVRAFWINLSQSEDLRDALNDFFAGMGMTSTILEGLTIGQ